MDEKDAVKMDAGNLWREETITDRKVGTIRRMIPIKLDGSADLSRKETFVGEATLMTPVGSLPLNFEIPAANLSEAVAAYGKALEKAYAEALDELEQVRRRASSQIIVPPTAAPPDLKLR